MSEQMEWQPIETAPLNELVLTIQTTSGDFEGYYEVMRCYVPEKKLWLGRFGMMPTHWMPLPAPPALSKAGA